METEKLGVEIPSFSGKPEHWHHWKRKFVASLDMLDYLEGLTVVRPPNAAGDAGPERVQEVCTAQETWDERNRRIFNWLSFYTEGVAACLISHFDETRDGVRAWNQLVGKYEHMGSTGRATLQSELIQGAMGETEDPDL